LAKSKSSSARGRLRAFLLANIGTVVTSKQLRDAAGTDVSEWARRVRELRQDEGYQILTNNDRADLKPGQYLLLDPKPVPSFESTISKETRAFVLDRNGNTCQSCGAAAGEPHPYDSTRSVRLHMGHVIDKSKGGTDDASNLKALCSVCNEGLQNITPMRPDLKHLLIQVRRARSDDQVAVLEWLRKKFAGVTKPPKG